MVLPILVAMWAMGFASILVTVVGPAPEVWPTIRRLPELALIAAAAALCVLPGQRDENRYGPPPGGPPFRDVFG